VLCCAVLWGQVMHSVKSIAISGSGIGSPWIATGLSSGDVTGIHSLSFLALLMFLYKYD
jgi:hypothetical protein